MIFEVKRFADLRKLVISDGMFLAQTAWLDKEDRQEYAARLIKAASDLLHGIATVEQFISEDVGGYF